MDFSQTFAIDAIDDPDTVGESEYRALHELLGEVDGETVGTVIATLDSVIEHAKRLKTELAERHSDA